MSPACAQVAPLISATSASAAGVCLIRGVLFWAFADACALMGDLDVQPVDFGRCETVST